MMGMFFDESHVAEILQSVFWRSTVSAMFVLARVSPMNMTTPTLRTLESHKTQTAQGTK
jgi:hypothetical protein